MLVSTLFIGALGGAALTACGAADPDDLSCDPYSCPGVDEPCRIRACEDDECTFVNVPPGPSPEPDANENDCVEYQCDGNGSAIEVAVDRWITDMNVCTTDKCEDGVPIFTRFPAGSVCDDNLFWKAYCSVDGECLTCTDFNDCTIDDCSGGDIAPTPLAKDTPCGWDSSGRCDGEGTCLIHY
jgi:hypothetical protein